MADIFLSYANADRERINPLVKILEEWGWSVWWDRKIPPGKTWHQVIQRAIDEAKCVVVVWSHLSIQSDWVITEAEEGKDRQVLIPVLIDDVKAPLAFRRIQAARLIGWDGEPSHHELGVLFEAIEAIVGKPEKSREVAQFEERAETPQPSPAQAVESHLNPAPIAWVGQEHSSPQTQRPDNVGLYDARTRTKDDIDDISDAPSPYQGSQGSTVSVTHFDTPKGVSKPEFEGQPTLPEHEVSEWPALPEPDDTSIPVKDISDRLRLRLIIGMALVAIALVIAVGSVTYFKRQARDAQKRAQMEIENGNQKDGLIGRLRDKIAELNKRIQQSDKSSSRRKYYTIVESLNRLSLRLDDVNRISPDKLSEIRQACEDVRKELNKIEAEIDSLQG
jgi:TIR domain-containing protein